MNIWMGRWALALMLISLCAISGSALEGETQDMTLDTVTCLNHTTGEAAVGVVTGSAFDCSALAADEGDIVGVVLLGTTPMSSGGETCTNLQSIREEEPNNTRENAQELPQPCVSIRGNANTSNDLDAFRLHLPAPTRLRFTLSPSPGTALDIVFFDGTTVERLGTCGEMGSQERTCQGLFSPAIVDIVIFAEGNIGTYTLDIFPVLPTATHIEGATYDRRQTGGIR